MSLPSTFQHHFRLMFKMSLLPWVRSFALQSLVALALAQLFLGTWLGGAIDQEIRRTKKFASQAKWITVQIKSNESIGLVKPILEGQAVTLEEISTEDVLARMEPEEPEVVQTVRAMGKEGLQLVPQVLLIRGVVTDETLEQLKRLPDTHKDIYRVEASPVHHARLLSFYQHLQLEMRVGMALILFLVMVILLGLQRIELRDLREVKENLLTWGANHVQSRMPLFFSLLLMAAIAGAVSIFEWALLRKFMWKNNPFLGELSIDSTFHFPMPILIWLIVCLFFLISLLSFSGRQVEE